jgi:hypothetical protein
VTRAHMKTAILSSPMRSPTKVVLRSHNSSDMDLDLAGLDLAGDAGRDAGDIKSELVTLPARPMSHTKKKVHASCCSQVEHIPTSPPPPETYALLKWVRGKGLW